MIEGRGGGTSSRNFGVISRAARKRLYKQQTVGSSLHATSNQDKKAKKNQHYAASKDSKKKNRVNMLCEKMETCYIAVGPTNN